MMDRGQRRRLALAATALWIAGFEVLPNVHVGLHDRIAAHSHGDGGGGLVVHVSYDRHRHDDGTWHAHDGVARGDRVRPDGGARVAAPDEGLAHGEHSLAHRGLVTTSPPPVVVHPVPVSRTITIVDQVAARAPRSADAIVATARGPPAA